MLNAKSQTVRTRSERTKPFLHSTESEDSEDSEDSDKDPILSDSRGLLSSKITHPAALIGTAFIILMFGTCCYFYTKVPRELSNEEQQLLYRRLLVFHPL